MNVNQTTSAKISGSDTAWILISTCLVFIMVPGVGYYYAGVVDKKSQLTTLFSSFLAIAVVSFQWFLWGYSLAFSENGSFFIGNFDYIFLNNVGNEPHKLSPTVPGNTFMIYQCMFAIATASLTFGSVAGRAKISTFILFLFVWSTFVYDFIAYWTWSLKGWLRKIEMIDFAGGTPVHVTAGFASMAFAIATGPRQTVRFDSHKATDLNNIYLGTLLSWFGWFGFNGGSEFSVNSRASNAVIVTNLAGSVGGLSWIIIEMIRKRSTNTSLNGFCAGVMAGLVVITPASGFVKPYCAIIFGVIGSLCCFFACDLKKLTRYKFDDACDVFAIHGVGGIVGSILTGIFAEKSVAVMSGDPSITGGWIDQNFNQVVSQLIGVTSGATWSFVVTFIIVELIGFIPGFKLRLSEKEEEIGSDWIELGESAYGHDIKKYTEEFLNEIRLKSVKESNLDILRSYLRDKVPDKTVTLVKFDSDSILTNEENRVRNDSLQNLSTDTILSNISAMQSTVSRQ